MKLIKINKIKSKMILMIKPIFNNKLFPKQQLFKI